MLPNNDELRAKHQPLAKFVDEVYQLELGFVPGTAVQYQSMGTLMVAEIVHQVAGVELGDFLKREIFGPLGMADTSLGWDVKKKGRIVPVKISPEQAKTDWNWNSPYWLAFGAPWGGLITSPADFARFCQMMLNGGVLDGVRILSTAGVRAMTSNQLEVMPKVPEEERRCRPWGLGWRFGWPGQPGSYGDLLNPRTFGHSGATGTLCWMDPEAGAFFILFTTQPEPANERIRGYLSNIVMASLL
jgi:CubicO group peptidase (beta-lactamase class C family)